MSTIGIWIDHTLARVVRLAPGGTELVTVESGAEPLHRSTGSAGVPLPGHIGGFVDGASERRRDLALRKYYDRVLEAAADASRVLILGPGEAKKELRARMRETARGGSSDVRVVAVEPAQRMTDPQLVACIRSEFGEESERILP